VLLQRSEGGGLVSSGGNPMAGRGSANVLTRMTAWLATAFFATSIVLTLLAQHGSRGRSILDEPAAKGAPAKSGPALPTPSVPTPAPASPGPTAPAPTDAKSPTPAPSTPLPSLPPAPGAPAAPAPSGTAPAPASPAPAAPGTPPRSNWAST